VAFVVGYDPNLIYSLMARVTDIANSPLKVQETPPAAGVRQKHGPPPPKAN